MNTTSLVKWTQQRLHFRHRMRKAHLPPPILTKFYRSTIKSILTSCISVWWEGWNLEFLFPPFRTSPPRAACPESVTSSVTPHTPTIDCSPCWPPKRGSVAFGAEPPSSVIAFSCQVIRLLNSLLHQDFCCIFILYIFNSVLSHFAMKFQSVTLVVYWMKIKYV